MEFPGEGSGKGGFNFYGNDNQTQEQKSKFQLEYDDEHEEDSIKHYKNLILQSEKDSLQPFSGNAFENEYASTQLQ